ncbi:prephenate dehydrogenase [Rubellicoccus peritrichatus]|uniref:Prephenate dehydrogenase/arogenate dehydrogenase family protein n=1 Tax=Rubellicoccus peritrichatus TaxID=3080537 RepID=A0AAQ3LBB0_9BACT|nr:prephenate dehydrogenase/arogenate dehydrogenase family protein [Puniceicoccus sp. CR14]WOO42944.1 prephenate dehydrogenase/arogenate dehydrogenase family protein [Puniceicoccus sp. CR14]
MFRSVCILGPGLLGASLMQALRERGLAERLTTWSRRAETRLKCEGKPWCDAVYPTALEAVDGADLIVICLPVEHIVPTLEGIRSAIKPGCLVTDVGSTKSLICRHGQAIMPEGVDFIGSHPMVGSEKTGPENGYAELFEGGACFVTPLVDTPQAVIEKTIRLWKAVGMEVGSASPEKHDEIVAHISHLPHFLASALCSYLATQNNDWQNFAGAGLRDTTRIASGDPALWKSIASQNREEILRALDGFEEEIQRFRSALHNEKWFEIINLLERGKTYRDRLRMSK